MRGMQHMAFAADQCLSSRQSTVFGDFRRQTFRGIRSIQDVLYPTYSCNYDTLLWDTLYTYCTTQFSCEARPLVVAETNAASVSHRRGFVPSATVRWVDRELWCFGINFQSSAALGHLALQWEKIVVGLPGQPVNQHQLANSRNQLMTNDGCHGSSNVKLFRH
ncbi:hypothetical protein PUN28_010911 [Cardiocondyla obscurior]|uniref:Uncharacterized protein n=1 Tax=Cardiocondyla obscurior TaxID=286306 RepID=A0AAW2FKJ9_9HYME